MRSLTTDLQLSIDDLRLPWRSVDAFLPIATARRLRDQLTAHLDAVHSYPNARAETHQGNLTPRGDGPTAAGPGCFPECVGQVVRGSAE